MGSPMDCYVGLHKDNEHVVLALIAKDGERTGIVLPAASARNVAIRLLDRADEIASAVADKAADIEPVGSKTAR